MVSAFDTLDNTSHFSVHPQSIISGKVYRRGLGPNVAKAEQLPYELYTYLSRRRNTNQENRLDKYAYTDRHTQTHSGTHIDAQAMHTFTPMHTYTHTNTHTITYANIKCTFKRVRHRRAQINLHKSSLSCLEPGAGVIESTWISSYPAWYMARRICCTNASLVGGISSTLWPQFVKNFRQQLLTSSTVEALSYRRHVNLSMTHTLSSCGSKLWYVFEYRANTGVDSSNTCHVAHAVNLFFLLKAETVAIV